MFLTEKGFNIKRFDDIQTELRAAVTQGFGLEVDTTSDSVLGVLISIWATAISEQWELSQAVNDAFNKDKAEGKNLDDLAALIGVTRISATKTTGVISLTGNINTLVPQFSVFSSPSTSDKFDLLNNTTLSPASCTSCDMQVDSLMNSVEYSISINDEIITYTSDPSATNEEVILGLNTSLQSSINYGIIFLSETSLDDLTLTLYSTSDSNSIKVIPSTFLITTEVTSLGIIVAQEDGSIAGSPNSINVIDTPTGGLDSANNPSQLLKGRGLETDEELRIRMTESVQVAGKATVPAIEAALRDTIGVEFARVVENIHITSDVDGRPPKSFECIVEGGSEEDIALTIWDTKPAGIETYGNITEVILDNNGNDVAVHFSRPTPVYIHVKIVYSKYSEEDFPDDGEAAIVQAVYDKGNSIGIDGDIIPKRFYGPVYSNVNGVDDLTITMASTTSAVDTPPPLAFTEDRIPISGSEKSIFDLAKITINLGT